MKKTLFILLLLFPLLSSAQLCRYCTNDEMLEMFDEHEYKAEIGYTDSGTKYYYIEHGYCTQIYYMYYDVNTIYAILSSSEKYIKNSLDKLNKEYTKTSPTTWKNDKCNVELQYQDGTYALVFNYR